MSDDYHGDPAYGCGLLILVGIAFWVGIFVGWLVFDRPW